jgi:S-adenosylmethionine:tRNA ribosyltransferase-isomerase
VNAKDFIVKTERFNYHLPEKNIAQVPADRRDHSRLLVIHRKTKTVEHKLFQDIVDYIPTGTRMFRNNAAVLKARLRGFRPTGGAVECLLLHPDKNPTLWWCLVKPGRRLGVGATFSLKGFYKAEVVDVKETGERLIQFHTENNASVPSMADAAGEMPLPPYIRREKEDSRRDLDNERYQTVYADRNQKVAAAAPTAGLHFTPEVLSKLQEQDVSIHDITLHVGLGTFKPVQEEEIEKHPMHSEFYEIGRKTLDALINEDGKPRMMVGTTSMRATEDFFNVTGGKTEQCPFVRDTDIFIYPPYNFHCDILLTNFHLPKSTLLCLVSAFLTPGSEEGIEWLLEIYKEAIQMDYRFYSYGDAMLIL